MQEVRGSNPLSSARHNTSPTFPRSVVEVEADEVAPSLKFATARPERAKAKAAAGTDRTGHFDDEPPF